MTSASLIEPRRLRGAAADAGILDALDAARIERMFYSDAGGNEPAKDDAWPPPRSWRHVWIRFDHSNAAPLPELILYWRLTGIRWSGWVVWIDNDSGPSWRRVRQGWIPAEHLRPAISDRNIWNDGPWR